MLRRVSTNTANFGVHILRGCARFLHARGKVPVSTSRTWLWLTSKMRLASFDTDARRSPCFVACSGVSMTNSAIAPRGVARHALQYLRNGAPEDHVGRIRKTLFPLRKSGSSQGPAQTRQLHSQLQVHRHHPVPGCPRGAHPVGMLQRPRHTP